MYDYEVAIVGAGPIGLELAILLKQANINYIQFDAHQVGNTISQWPPRAQFFSAPERVSIAGIPVHSENQQSITGEAYLSYLRVVVEHLDLTVKTFEKVIDIERLQAGGFRLHTETWTGKQSYKCQKVVLATGNMNVPRRLNIPGEDLSQVDHRLADPHKYFNKRLLIVGGKNSALEAALRCWRAGAKVYLSYRRDEFETLIVKPHLSKEINLLIKKGVLTFYPETVPLAIKPGVVTLVNSQDQRQTFEVEIDFVLMCVGFEMDTTLLERVGVTLEGEIRKPSFDKDTMETNVPDFYVAGTAAGGTQKKHDLFIVTCHIHAERIAKALVGTVSFETGAESSRKYEVSFEDVQAD